MEAVKAWLALEGEDQRLVFYSAAEEEEVRQSPPPRTPARARASLPEASTLPGKAGGAPKAGAKKPTVAFLAQQLETVLSALPAITDQLTALTLRQDAMEKGKGTANAGPSFQPLTSTKTAQPVSALLSGNPAHSIANLSKAVGPPPKVRSMAAQLPVEPVQHVEQKTSLWIPYLRRVLWRTDFQWLMRCCSKAEPLQLWWPI
eukprot:s824_g2.t1